MKTDIDYRMLAEAATIKHLMTNVYPTGIMSYVSDTYDFWRVVTDILPLLKKDIMARNGKLVIRPDSGTPADILCGTVRTGGNTPQEKGLIQCLWDTFGGTLTKSGYKLLDEHIGSIYGDSITLQVAEQICARLEARGFASVNWVAGVGSFTYQNVTRDTLGTAIKATYGVVNGEGRAIFKAPKTDSGEKNSAKGLLRVEKEGDDFVLYENQTWEQEASGALEPVFYNSQMLRIQTLAEIREILHGNK